VRSILNVYCQPFCLWGTAGTANECEKEKEARRDRVEKLTYSQGGCEILKSKIYIYIYIYIYMSFQNLPFTFESEGQNDQKDYSIL